MTSKLPDIPEPVTMKIRHVEKLKVIGSGISGSLEVTPTPDSRPLICMNEDQNDAGYDRDGAIGPFFDAVCDEPPLHGPDLWSIRQSDRP